MPVRIHPHPKERMEERGAVEGEVVAAIGEGEHFPVRFGRTGFRRNFVFESDWRGEYYSNKQVELPLELDLIKG